MQEKVGSNGKVFFIASSLSDFEANMSNLEFGSTVVLLGVSLQAIEEPENTILALGHWYEVSDQTGKMPMNWPDMVWNLDACGLTDEMRQCGHFYAPALQVEYYEYYEVGLVNIFKIIKPGSPKRNVKSSGIRNWIGKLIPSFAPQSATS